MAVRVGLFLQRVHNRHAGGVCVARLLVPAGHLPVPGQRSPLGVGITDSGLRPGVLHVPHAAADEVHRHQDIRILEAARRRHIPDILLLRHGERVERSLEPSRPLPITRDAGEELLGIAHSMLRTASLHQLVQLHTGQRRLR